MFLIQNKAVPITETVQQNSTSQSTQTMAEPEKKEYKIAWEFPIVLFETNKFEVVDEDGLKYITFSQGENQGISIMPIPPGKSLIPGKDTIKVKGQVKSDLNHSNGTILFIAGDFNSSIIALDGKKRTVVWNKRGPYYFLATTDSDVIAVTDKEVSMFSVIDGSEKWKYQITNVTFKPVIFNGIVYLGTKNKFLYGLDLKSGKERFKIIYNDIGLVAQNDDSNLYVCGSNFLQKIDLQTQKILWNKGVRYDDDDKRDVGCSSFLFGPSISLDVENVYLADGLGSLVAFDKKTGTKKWSLINNLGLRKQEFFGSVSAKDNVVYTGSDKGLQGIDPKNGNVLWSLYIENAPTGLLIRDGIIYFGTSAGDFYGYAISTREKVFEHIIQKETGISKPIENTPLSVGNMVYFGGKEGVLYALEIK